MSDESELMKKVGNILMKSETEAEALKALSIEIPNDVEVIDVFMLKLANALSTKFYRQLISAIKKGDVYAEKLYLPEQGDHTH